MANEETLPETPTWAEAAVWARDGGLVAAVEGSHREDPLRRAELIAAAGTAAHEAREMGYDPQTAVEMLPDLLRRLEDVVDLLGRLEDDEGVTAAQKFGAHYKETLHKARGGNE